MSRTPPTETPGICPLLAIFGTCSVTLFGTSNISRGALSGAPGIIRVYVFLQPVHFANGIFPKAVVFLR